MNTKINIDGVDYNIDLEQAKKMGLIKPVFVSPKVGMRFIRKKYSANNEKYILASVGCHEVSLIGLETGIRWVEPVTCKDTNNITESEWVKIQGNENYFVVVKY